jgi:N-acyl homoserine lactone hydrolase
MNVQLISTGHVKITQNWLVGKGTGMMRLINALTDRRFSDWLPIYCTVIEHPEGLVVIDTGIPASANDRVYFPPHIPLLQRAAPFQITPEQEIGPQMQARGLDPRDVRWVISTHLHQDHDGGMNYFPNAEFLIGRKEWAAGQGWGGRMNGYFNWRWAKITPRLVDFTSGAYHSFASSETVTRAGDIRLVPTPGHSRGHLSVVVEQGDHMVFVAGDSAYTQELLINDVIDGVAPDAEAEHDSHRRILELARQVPMIFLPSHDPDAEDQLQNRIFVPVEHSFC